jgi:hypothetical protein
VDFRYAESSEYDSISRFIDCNWAKDHAYVRFPQLFEWTFREHGLWREGEYSFTLAEDKGEIVGILGGIPFLFNCYGQVSLGVWIVNFMVRHDYRRGPTALSLLEMFRRPFGTVISFGNNPAVVPFYRALRARILNEIPRHFMILPNGEARMTRLMRLTYPNWPAERAENLAREFGTHDPAASADCSYSDSLPPDWDQQWRRLSLGVIGAARDLKYLTWRYVMHPCFRYHFIAVREGDRIGLLIWRLEIIRRATADGLEDVDRIGRVVEFLPASRNNAKILVSLLRRNLDSAGAFGADYYGFHGESRSWLQEFGFPQVSDCPDGAAIPSRFQPLEAKDGNVLSSVFVQDSVPQCSPEFDCRWYWTKSDSDQDRPN